MSQLVALATATAAMLAAAPARSLGAGETLPAVPAPEQASNPQVGLQAPDLDPPKATPPKTGAPAVDGPISDGAGQVDKGVGGAVEKVNETARETAGVGGGSSGGGSPSPPSQAPSASEPSGSSAGSPTDSSRTPGSSGSGRTRSADPSGGGSRAQGGRRARGGARGGSTGAPQAGGRAGSASPQASRGGQEQTRTSALPPLIRTIAELPPAVLVALAALAAIGIAMTARSGLASRLARRLGRRADVLQLDVGTLQEALVPDFDERIAGVPVAAAFRPADGPAAGGDFHDVFELPEGRLGIVVGDVSGHGREAVSATAIMRFTVRAHLSAGSDPRETLRLTEAALDEELGDRFATVLAGVYDPAEATLTYSCAGHPPPLLRGGSSDEHVAALGGAPIGLPAPSAIRLTQLPVGRGEEIWMVSDGPLEALDDDGEMLGTDGLRELLAKRPGAAPEELLERLSARGEGVGDDLTALVIRPERGAEPATPRIEQVDLSPGVRAEDLEELLTACRVPADRREAAIADALSAVESGPIRIELRLSTDRTRWSLTPIHSQSPVTGGEAAAAPRALVST